MTMPNTPGPQSVCGQSLLHDPLLNQGDGFSPAQRDKLGLRGLTPPHTMDLAMQAKREKEACFRSDAPLDHFIHLMGLLERDETLFYYLLTQDPLTYTPIVYTPTVGLACQQYSHIFQQPRGMFFSAEDRGQFREMMNNWPEDEIDIIVVTDGSRVLGLGDLGAGGMGISVGKIALYIAAGGLHPKRTLAVDLDVGTNNQELLDDPMYIGLRQKRLNGDAYDSLVDEFIRAAHDRWPMALIQFEDFTNDHAFPLLERYRKEILCFNDDIQGTGAVALAGILAALRITRKTLNAQRIVFCGAGSAAIGIADMIVAGMVAESGISETEARRHFWLLDSKGLVSTQRGDKLATHKLPYARNESPVADLKDLVEQVKPTIIMGLSGQPGMFTEDVVRTMHQYVERPIIFSLSNPTSKAECTAEQAYSWTEGACIFASGSPFDPVEYKGVTHVPGQGNNMFIFPGVGLGATLCGAREVTDSMFYVAARTLAEKVTETDLQKGTVYPELNRIREISAAIATATCRLAWDQGLATHPEQNDPDWCAKQMYQPVRPTDQEA